MSLFNQFLSLISLWTHPVFDHFTIKEPSYKTLVASSFQVSLLLQISLLGVNENYTPGYFGAVYAFIRVPS